MQCRYGFPIYGASVNAKTEIADIALTPVFMLPPTALDVASFQRLGLPVLVERWLAGRAPSAAAGLMVDCTVYSMDPSLASKAKLPILRLRRLWLPISAVAA
jgi:hypothetical protein